MTVWQGIILNGFVWVNFGILLIGIWQSFIKKNSYGNTWFLLPIGIFVWGDALIYSPFWIAVALISRFSQDWLLFWLTASIYMAVRGLGETMFWIQHQFSVKQIYPAKTLPGYKLVKNESIWFIYQIISQCATIVGLVASLYFGKLWLR